METLNNSSTTARDLRLELLEKITSGFSEEHKIGSGGYGKVYKGVLNGTEIALKKLHGHVALDDVIFKNECENLMRVRHQNIVELVGYCHEIRHRYVEHNGRTVYAEMVDRLLCFEYLQNGSLDKHLYEEHRGLDWCTRYRIIKGICEGLNYLHGLEESILHLDLKPANILLDENMVPKIADFGLSRLFGGTHTHITKNPVGTEMYRPPEYVNKCIITKKYDVFSLGVIIIQIMTGREGCSKYREMSSQQFIEHVHQNWKVRVEATSMHTSSAEDCKQVKRCIEIALNCVETEREKRPTIGHIIHKLRETETVTREVPMPFSQESGSASSSHFKTEMVQNWSQEEQRGGQVKDSSNQQREVLQKQSGMQQKDSSNAQPGSLEKEYQEDTKKHAASGTPCELPLLPSCPAHLSGLPIYPTHPIRKMGTPSGSEMLQAAAAAGNPMAQQQHMAQQQQMMMNGRGHGHGGAGYPPMGYGYERPPMPYPMSDPMPPQPHAGRYDYFSDENPNSCSVM